MSVSREDEIRFIAGQLAALTDRQVHAVAGIVEEFRLACPDDDLAITIEHEQRPRSRTITVPPRPTTLITFDLTDLDEQAAR